MTNKLLGMHANAIDKALWAVADIAREYVALQATDYDKRADAEKRLTVAIEALTDAERRLSREVSVRFREGEYGQPEVESAI